MSSNNYNLIHNYGSLIPLMVLIVFNFKFNLTYESYDKIKLFIIYYSLSKYV